MPVTEPARFPGYDVLAKRDTPSWNAKTREVIEQRLATPDVPNFFTAEEWCGFQRCRPGIPNPRRPPVPI
jgi:hypothetical protein